MPVGLTGSRTRVPLHLTKISGSGSSEALFTNLARSASAVNDGTLTDLVDFKVTSDHYIAGPLVSADLSTLLETPAQEDEHARDL